VLATVSTDELLSCELSDAPRESSRKSGRSGFPLASWLDVPASDRFRPCQLPTARHDRLRDLTGYVGESS
jgi:hypothetical protein